VAGHGSPIDINTIIDREPVAAKARWGEAFEPKIP
jgi:hypothetical protein